MFHCLVVVHRLELSTPQQFFDGIEESETQNLCTWSGELYLEMHNGTYTTQSQVTSDLRCQVTSSLLYVASSSVFSHVYVYYLAIFILRFRL